MPANTLIAELQRAAQDTWYTVRSWKTLAIDEHAVIVSGRMRRSVPRGGFEDAAHVWLLTVSDDLIYRQGVSGTEQEAAGAYRQLGVSLGIPAAPAKTRIAHGHNPNPASGEIQPPARPDDESRLCEERVKCRHARPRTPGEAAHLGGEEPHESASPRCDNRRIPFAP